MKNLPNSTKLNVLKDIKRRKEEHLKEKKLEKINFSTKELKELLQGT